MATTLLQQPQHPFQQLGNQFTQGVYTPFLGQQALESNSRIPSSNLTSTETQVPFASPPRWSASQAAHRRTSKSPNIQDRTPIRHSRPDMSRHRSISRPELFMAYAQEQTRQAPPDTSRNLYVPPIESATQSYQPHQYAFPPVTSPYMQQQAYFEPPGTHTGYTQHAPHQHQVVAPSVYPSNRNGVPLSQNAGPSLNPVETVYNQQRTPQLPSMPSVPSNFPPIPQPLESTPSEVDIVGSRQKPQCWDHGCNGRQFSTFSNLLRHQREKSGTATKARCPHCGTEFTRTTARNGHLYGGKCKGIPDGGKDESRVDVSESDGAS